MNEPRPTGANHLAPPSTTAELTSPPSASWTPMRRAEINPQAQRMAVQLGDPMDEVWGNDIYECQVRYLEPNGRCGALHLSIKRRDRGPERDWRHLQAIKNEVCGAEREGIELFPAESRLVDSANQIHLWVMGPGGRIPFGYNERIVATDEQMVEELRSRGASEEMVAASAKARQRPWEPGISTGPGYKS